MTNRRTFTDRPATRERVPLLIGLVGPSGGGKTFSALRLATGIQRVSGGDIFVVDTEARRSLHYASDFKFRHVDFAAPFGSLDYLAAIEHCVAKGAGVVIVDSMSHEHEGPGGLLEQHEAEAKRLAALWGTRLEVAKMSAWAAPKAARRRMINTILQLPCNFIFCFRAKEKLKIEKGKDPQHMGYMAIAGEEFVFEMGVNALLLPGAGGVPTWVSDEMGERQQIKRPGWSSSIFGDRRPLDEAHGEALARWAVGPTRRTVSEIAADYQACTVPAHFGTLEAERKSAWRALTADEKATLKAASEAAKARLDAAEAQPPITPEEAAAIQSREAAEADAGKGVGD